MATVHQFFVPGPLTAGSIALPASTARQVSTVLRLRSGDRLVLFDGTGGEWLGEIHTSGHHGVAVRLLEHRSVQVEPAERLTLYQALLKADKFEWVLQKGTELGVAAFRPLLTRRVVVVPTHARARAVAAGAEPAAGAEGAWSARRERWQRIVVEAAEQSGRDVVPVVHTPQPLEAALDAHYCGCAVICWEGERRRSFGAALAAARAGGGGAVDVFIGPEGGFTDGEVAAAVGAGAVTAALGPRILRSETAALAAVVLTLLPH